MELLNILSFFFINIAAFGALVFLIVLPVVLLGKLTTQRYQAFVLLLLWLILLALLAGVGAYITA